MTLSTLRPFIIRYRAAQAALDLAQRRLVTAEAEHVAARQELDDALINEFRGVT